MYKVKSSQVKSWGYATAWRSSSARPPLLVTVLRRKLPHLHRFSWFLDEPLRSFVHCLSILFMFISFYFSFCNLFKRRCKKLWLSHHRKILAGSESSTCLQEAMLAQLLKTVRWPKHMLFVAFLTLIYICNDRHCGSWHSLYGWRIIVIFRMRFIYRRLYCCSSIKEASNPSLDVGETASPHAMPFARNYHVACLRCQQHISLWRLKERVYVCLGNIYGSPAAIVASAFQGSDTSCIHIKQRILP